MSTKVLALCLLFGAAGGGIFAFALESTRGEETSIPPTAAEKPVDRPDAPAGSAPQPIELGEGSGPRLLGSAEADEAWRQALEERIVRLESKVTTLAAQVAATGDGDASADLADLTDDELKARGRSLYAFKNYAGTLEAYKELLARNPGLDAKTRGDIMSTIAQCHRALGDTKTADEVFQQVEALHGPGTAGALTARYQRAWLKLAEDDVEGARAFMREVARSENSPKFWKLYSRANAADFSIKLGDTAHARTDLEEYKVELEADDSPTAQRVLAYVNRLLEGLENR